jgi:hypothetical protein
MTSHGPDATKLKPLGEVDDGLALDQSSEGVVRRQ